MKTLWVTTTVLCSLLLYSTQFAIANESLIELENKRANQTEGRRFTRNGKDPTPQLQNRPFTIKAQPKQPVRTCTDTNGKKLTLAKVIRSFCVEMVARSGTKKGGHRYGKWGPSPIMVKAK